MYRVEMAFGHRDSNGLALSDEQIIGAEYLALTGFAEQFAGAQLHRHPGVYRQLDGHVVVEPSSSVLAYTADVMPALEPLLGIARSVAAMMRQESVFLVIIKQSGRMYWVSPKPGKQRRKARRRKPSSSSSQSVA
jgi:hypothetical protein